jgi:epoxyqueuosine reductase
MGLFEDIKQRAIELGFDLVGVTDASPINVEQVELLTGWLGSGRAGQMNYLHRNFEKRINPANLLEGAQSVICVGLNYKPPKQKALDTTGPTGSVASYARYEDYHIFIKKQLRKLVDFITSVAGREHKFKICVDSAPLTERALAARAGLGFIGKNHMLISPTLGPQIFLGEIITTLKLPIDKPIAGDCSDCSKCIGSCPTSALGPDGWFDANKCISYLTIEYKGRIPADLAEKIGDRLFGCDECVLACPYQQKAPVCKNTEFKFYSDRAEFDLQKILNMTEGQFQVEFADSVILRLGLDRLKRNAKICLANSKNEQNYG